MSTRPDRLEPGRIDLNRAELARLLHDCVDLALESVDLESQDPVRPNCDGESLGIVFGGDLPREGTRPEELLDELRRGLLPAQRRNGHPGFMGYVCASVDPVGAAFDGLASLWNQNLTAWRSAPGAVSMERQVLSWLDQWIGFGADGQGLLVSGGSTANLIAMSCALARAARGLGLEMHQALGRMTVYVCGEGHLSSPKAAGLLGLPAGNLRRVEVDAERRLDPVALAEAMERDVAAGLTPACVCPSAGTVNTGAIDPIGSIADVCAEHGAWMHVDGAYGAPVARLEAYAWLREGFARADSVSIDPHKWLFAPLGVGCLLVRDQEEARRVFHFDAEYTTVTQRDPTESFAFFDLGPELSRRNRALKVWAILKTHGADALVREIEREIAVREHFDGLIEREKSIEPLGSGLSVSCFRFIPPHESSPEQLNRLNASILEELNAQGHFFLSPTTLEGRFALRICIVNRRTGKEHVERLLEEVLRLGQRMGI